MTQARIDFSGQRGRGVTSRIDLVFLIMAIGMMGTACYQWHLAHQTHLELEVASEALNAADKHAASLSHEAPTAKLTNTQAGSLNQAIGKLNLPWPELFAALNASIPGKVALLAIHPNAQRQDLRLTAEADKVDEMMRCIRLLKQNPSFHDVRLLRSQIDDKDPSHPIRFELLLRWHQLERTSP